MTSTRTWTVELGRGRGLLFADEQMSPADQDSITLSLRYAVLHAAREAGVPALARAHVAAEYRPAPPWSGKRRQKKTFTLFDVAENLLPSAKAAAAALVDVGVLPRDPGCLTGPVMRLGEVEPGSQLVLHIQEIS